MAKDKALPNGLNSSCSPSAASSTIEMCNSLCATSPAYSPAICSIESAANISLPPATLVNSPSHSTDLSASALIAHNSRDLSIPPHSLMNSGTSLCIHSPRIDVDVHGPALCDNFDFDHVSSTHSATSATIDDAGQEVNRNLKKNTSYVVKSKRTSETIPSKRPCRKISHRRSIVNGLAHTLSLPTSSSNNEDNDNTSHESKSAHPRRRRAAHSTHANAVHRDRRNFSKRRLTLTLPVSLLDRSSISDSASSSPGSDSTCPSVLRSPRRVPHKISNQPKTLRCELPIVSGGLKIRLRRDSAPLDVSTKRNKRCKRKAEISFRIVESWCDTDAPGGDYSTRARAAVSSSSSPSFTPLNGSIRVGDIVWAKLAGYPYWPSRVSAIWARTAHQLSQAVLFPSQQPDTSSLSVLATPSDPVLAAGYTAKVDWLAWDQCSYLSCAKLYPFKEAYDKMYNPRTRVKGYAEAVRLAKRFATESHPTIGRLVTQTAELSPMIKPSSTLVSAPPSAESQWSTTNTLVCSTEPPSSFASNPPSRDTIEKDMSVASDTASVPITQLEEKDPFLDCRSHSPDQVSTLGLESDTFDLSVVADSSNWAPLPQLDISGLGDFVTHIPTFSEDEDEIEESVTSQLRLDFGSCT